MGDCDLVPTAQFVRRRSQRVRSHQAPAEALPRRVQEGVCADRAASGLPDRTPMHLDPTLR
jgi:hypothetical protein